MRWLRSTVGVLAALSLVACVPELPRKYVFGDQVWADGVTVKPRPGDVLYLTTWTNGMAITGAANQWTNGYPPMLVSERIPLRHIPESGTLHPLEAALLGSMLATHVYTTPTDVVALGNALEKEQVALWNSLVDSLVVAKTKSSQPMQLQLDETGKKDAQGAVLVKGFCQNFTEQEPGAAAQSAERQLILKTYFDKCDHPPSDLRNIGQLETSLAPLTRTQANIFGGFYSTDQTNIVSAARIELQVAGASMRQRDGIEGRWTLAEWESADICRDSNSTPLSITYINLGWRHRRGLKVLPASDGDAQAEITVGPDTTTGQGRSVQQKRKLLGKNTISHASLSFLYPADITEVNWGTDTSDLDAALRSACAVH
jgi:hypothetical protein